MHKYTSHYSNIQIQTQKQWNEKKIDEKHNALAFPNIRFIWKRKKTQIFLFLEIFAT